jgi:hypothetical protein
MLAARVIIIAVAAVVVIAIATYAITQQQATVVP